MHFTLKYIYIYIFKIKGGILVLCKNEIIEENKNRKELKAQYLKLKTYYQSVKRGVDHIHLENKFMKIHLIFFLRMNTPQKLGY